jgi:hypothetical protein
MEMVYPVELLMERSRWRLEMVYSLKPWMVEKMEMVYSVEPLMVE